MTIQNQLVASTYSCEAIYRKISNLINLEKLYQLLEEKQIKVSSFTSDRYEVQAQVMKFSADFAPIVSERIPTEKVRYQIEHDMFPAKVSIWFTLQESEGSTLAVSMEAELNPFIAGMVQSRLEEAVQYIANMLGQIRYDVQSKARTKAKIKSARTVLLSLMTLLLLGCQGEVQYATPLRLMYYPTYFTSVEGRALVLVGGYLRIAKPSMAISAIGFGGILAIHGFTGSGTVDYYYAYDPACLKELDPTSALLANDKLEAICPKRHSRFSIAYGGGTPVQEPAQSPLLPYRVLSINGGLLITTPEL